MSDPLAVLHPLLRELALPATALSPVLGHAAMVAEAADRLGLVTERTLEEIVRRHTADSVLFALVRSPDPGERWVDVGSGAGFPGLVLGLCYPGTNFVLAEPQQRRAGFLETTVANLGADNIEVTDARASELEPSFDMAVARALAEPALAFETLKRLIRPGGTVLVAVGSGAHSPLGVDEVQVRRPGVDSPGRFFMLADEPTGA